MVEVNPEVADLLYEEERAGVEDLEKKLKIPGMAHLLIINLGRDFCKALVPLHHVCPVESICPKRGVVRPGL